MDSQAAACCPDDTAVINIKRWRQLTQITIIPIDIAIVAGF